MKKTVLALAALAAVSTSALAQSSVSLYGVLDASLENLKGDDSVTRVSSDNLAISRFGVRGLEDLGGGLKAKFNLEAGVKVDTGASDSSAFWGRSAWVGIEGGFGELRLGRVINQIRPCDMEIPQASHTMDAARWMAPRKLHAVLS